MYEIQCLFDRIRIWLVKLLDSYLSDPELPRIRVFGDTFRLILGASAQKEGIGTADYGILVIETDGQINKTTRLKRFTASQTTLKIIDDPS